MYQGAAIGRDWGEKLVLRHRRMIQGVSINRRSRCPKWQALRSGGVHHLFESEH